jgi:hypothetical protein
VRVQRIAAPELGQELADLELEVVGQRLRGEERLLDLELRLPLAVDEVEQVRLAAEVAVHGAEQRQLRLLKGEAAPARVVFAELEPLDLVVPYGRGTRRGVDHQRDVDQARHCGPGAVGRRAGRRSRLCLEISQGLVERRAPGRLAGLLEQSRLYVLERAHGVGELLPDLAVLGAQLRYLIAERFHLGGGRLGLRRARSGPKEQRRSPRAPEPMLLVGEHVHPPLRAPRARRSRGSFEAGSSG